MVSCSKNNENAMISAADLFPEPSVFGDNCKVDKSVSDSVALSIIDGTYKSSSSEDEASALSAQCWYMEPKVIAAITRFPSVEECNEAYEKGLKLDNIKNLIPLEGFGVEGYRNSKDSSTGCRFKYGNVAVILLYYNRDHEDQLIRSLVKHFESKKN